jgi:anti-sigma B factor antagonist
MIGLGFFRRDFPDHSLEQRVAKVVEHMAVVDAAPPPVIEEAEQPRFIEPVEVDLPFRFQVSNRLAFHDKIVALLGKGVRHFVVQCAHTSYIDPAACGVLLRVSKLVQEHGGTLRLRNLNDDMRTVFELSRLDTRIDVEPPSEGATR